eukprot:115233_1
MPKRKKKPTKDDVNFPVGSAVELQDGLKGVIRYIGKLKSSNGKNKKGIFYGVELSAPKGKNDGFVNGKTYFMTKPNHGIFVKLSKIKCSISVIKNKLNPYPYITTQCFDCLLHVFILYLDDNTLCNLLKVETFCMEFNLKKLITPKQFMERFSNGIDTRLKKLQELYQKKVERYSSMKFATWNITNYNLKQKRKDKDKTMRRIACVSLLMQYYVKQKGYQMLGVNKDVAIDDEYLLHWTEYANKKMETNKNKKFNAFSYGGELLSNGVTSPWDSYDGKLFSKKTLNKIFTSGKVFGKDGKLLYNRIDRLLLGSMMELMVKEWIVLDGGISQDNMYEHHSERFTFVFGWLSPQCVVMIGGPYKVNSFDY